jgi:GNAT superfamily N-acetyltransferase
MTEFKRTSSDDADFALLIGLLDQELWRRYPETQTFFSAFNKIKLDAKAVVAYEDGKPVGCGCYRETAEGQTVEIKRMYVLDEKRSKGIAGQVLRELEVWAREAGNQRAILETGRGQPEAIALYTKSGYAEIDRYAPYTDREDSVCMGKDL